MNNSNKSHRVQIVNILHQKIKEHIFFLAKQKINNLSCTLINQFRKNNNKNGIIFASTFTCTCRSNGLSVDTSLI